MSKTYDELSGMIEVVGNEVGLTALSAGSLRIACHETDLTWIDNSYIITAEQVSTEDNDRAYDFVYGKDADEGQPAVMVWRLEDPHEVEWRKTEAEAREWMIEAASLYYDAD